MTKSDWKNLEKLVQIIEKSIDPQAIVQHDVKLPVLNSRIGATQQCDVVIYHGPKSRQTITIVEVQDRTSKVKPNDFRGWIQKLDDLGAQHLICVSKKAFPKSIKERSLLSGNKVRLVKIEELGTDSIPIGFFDVSFEVSNLDIVSFADVNIYLSKDEIKAKDIQKQLNRKIQIQSNDKVFTYDKVALITLFDLCKQSFDRPSVSSNGSQELSISKDSNPQLFLKIDNDFFRVGIECKFEWTYEHANSPVSILSYEQDEHGVLAWVIEGFYESNRGDIWFKIPLVRGNNEYVIGDLLGNIPKNMKLNMTIG